MLIIAENRHAIASTNGVYCGKVTLRLWSYGNKNNFRIRFRRVRGHLPVGMVVVGPDRLKKIRLKSCGQVKEPNRNLTRSLKKSLSGFHEYTTK